LNPKTFLKRQLDSVLDDSDQPKQKINRRIDPDLL
jgi:hypothetical protein